MKNILVPMDFTDVGVNALRFALNAFPNEKMTILYVQNLQLVSHDPILIATEMLDAKFWSDALEHFILRELKIKSIPANVKIEARFGSVVSSIKKYCNENELDAIVMGTRDKYNYFDKWFGTVSFGIVENSNIDVYLIPKYASYKGFDQVVVASDDHLADKTFMDKIKTWNKDHKAFIKFLHIQRRKEEPFQDTTNEIVQQLFKESDPDFGFEVSVVKDQDISHSLLASAYNMKADLLLIIPEDQTYIQSILFKSITKEMILQSDIPLLFIKPIS